LVLGSRADAVRILAASDLVLSTSRTEGAPGVAVEAGLAGVPVGGVDGGEISSIVRDGETGGLVGPGDLDAMADGAAGLLADPTRREQMGAAARDACAGFAMDRIVPRYASAFARVLRPRGGPLLDLSN